MSTPGVAQAAGDTIPRALAKLTMTRTFSDPPGEEALSQAMAGYQAGQLDAFDQVYAGLAGRLRPYLVSLTRDPARADDLLQETFLQIHRSRHTYRPHLPVLPWAFAIARHVYLMDRRAAWRRQRHEVGEPEHLPEPSVPSDTGRTADRDEVRRALQEVPRDRRRALVLHHVAGLTFREIGKRLGIREAAAKLRSSRGMSSLRDVLGGRRKGKKGEQDEP